MPNNDFMICVVSCQFNARICCHLYWFYALSVIFLSVNFQSVIFQSYIIHPCDLVRQLAVRHFPPLRLRPSFASPAFSTPCFYDRPSFSSPSNLNHPDQGRIKVRGGPRLDTVMGPYPSFISYHRLRTSRVWDVVPPKNKSQMAAGDF